MFTKVSSVTYEWRIKGFRIRTIQYMIALVGLVAGVALLPLSPAVGVAVWVFTFILSFAFATYVYRVDPDLVLGEVTLLKLLVTGLRNRFRTNAVVGED